MVLVIYGHGYGVLVIAGRCVGRCQGGIDRVILVAARARASYAITHADAGGRIAPNGATHARRAAQLISHGVRRSQRRLPIHEPRASRIAIARQ